MRPGSVRTIGAPARTGAVATTLRGTSTRICCTERRVTSAGPETAVTAPGAFQFTYRVGAGPFCR
jgi:hypothetical protein